MAHKLIDGNELPDKRKGFWQGSRVPSPKQPVVRLAGGLEVSGFTVRAKMYAPAHKYSDDLFYVKVTSPVALGSRQP